MAADKLLGPNGKSYTDTQINRFSIKRVFDILIDLGVSDNGQYKEHLRLQRPSSKRSRKRRRSRSRSRSRKRRRSSRPRTVVVYKPYYRSRSRSRSKPKKKRYVVVYRRPSYGKPRQPGVYRQQQPTRYSQPSGCPSHKTAIECARASCYWTGAGCLTP